MLKLCNDSFILFQKSFPSGTYTFFTCIDEKKIPTPHLFAPPVKKYTKRSSNSLHCKCFPHKNYSSGNYRVSAGIPCKNHRETLGILQGNPVIFAVYVNITGFPCKIPRVSLLLLLNRQYISHFCFLMKQLSLRHKALLLQQRKESI